MEEVISQSLIGQVSYFKRTNRILDMTHVFQSSRLFHRQWRKRPAVAIASFIINAYKRRSVLNAQNADVAPTTVGVAHLRFIKMWKPTHVLYIFTTRTFAHVKTTHDSQVIVLSRPNSECCGKQSGPHKITKYNIWVLFVVRKCVSGEGINDLSAFHSKFTFDTLHFNIH